MKTFKDSTGREWTIAINVGSIKRVKELISVDLTELLAGAPALIDRLGSDLILIVDVIYALCKPQADDRKIDDVAFASVIDGAAGKAAYMAFREDLADFFSQWGRDEQAAVIRRQAEFLDTGIKAVTAEIEALDPAKIINEQIQKAKQERSGEQSTSSPASSA
jgi:hypothetical protein